MTDIHPDMIKAKQAAESELLRRPGVTGVDIGYKEVKGKPTGVLAIRVLVDKKRNVPAKDRIPAEINGYPTDVIERRFELHSDRKLVAELVAQADTGTYTPLKGGISIGPCRAVGGYVYVGTLGAIVEDNVSHKPFMLSNFHVMCIDNTYHTGDNQAQPGLVDTGTCPTDVVGTLQRQSLGGSVDCAVADITAARGTACEIVDIGAIAGTNTVTVGENVRKRGRTTGLTYGIVDSVSLSVNIDYGPGIGSMTLTNQIGVKPDTAHNAKFGDHGDSGSVVVNNAREVVGLHFAGDDTGYGVANPIAAVLSALNVSLCTQVKLKDLKEHKLEKLEKIEIKEWKEHKEKPEKVEIKEWKEHKDKPEKAEIKEKHEKLEIKDIKESKLEKREKLELKEQTKLEQGEKGIIGPKEKDGKEIKEGGFEGPGGPGGPGDPGPGFDQRLAALEQVVGQLSHFITSAQRPDLAYGALAGEADIAARLSALANQGSSAKDLKDKRDC